MVDCTRGVARDDNTEAGSMKHSIFVMGKERLTSKQTGYHIRKTPGRLKYLFSFFLQQTRETQSLLACSLSVLETHCSSRAGEREEEGEG